MSVQQILIDNFKETTKKFDNTVNTSFMISCFFVLWSASITIDGIEDIVLNFLGIELKDYSLTFIAFLGFHMILYGKLFFLFKRFLILKEKIGDVEIVEALSTSSSYLSLSVKKMLFIGCVLPVFLCVSCANLWEFSKHIMGVVFVLPQYVVIIFMVIHYRRFTTSVSRINE